MTVSVTSAISGPYTPNSVTTAFPFTFKAMATDEVGVLRGGVEVFSGFTVFLTDPAGGTVTFTSAPATGSGSILIFSRPDFTQDIDFTNTGPFLPESHDEANDRAAVRDISLKQHVDQLLPTSMLDPAVRAGKFSGFDAQGVATPLSGTGSDTALRTDLAASTGSSLVGWIKSAAGAVLRSIASLFEERVSLLDFIPVSEHAAIKARTSTTDLANYITSALAYLDSIGGGKLLAPSGRYRSASSIELPRKVTIQGDGKHATHFQFTQAGTTVDNGSGFKNVELSNGSHAVYDTIRDLTIEMTHASNVGACFYDNCSTYLLTERVSFVGGKYGVAWDQTEVSTIRDCEFAGQITAGLWLVNGPDITVGNLGVFTNEICVERCQFNETGGAWAILDDGGDCHYYGPNNINGGGCRFAGVANLTIVGGEFESVNGRPTMTFSNLTLSGAGAGSCSAVICNGLITQPAGQPCISIAAMGNLHMIGMHLTATGVGACISGMNNVGTFFGRTNVNANPAVPLLDGYAASVHDDGYPRIITYSGTAVTGSFPDINSISRFTNAGAITYTVPANATVGFPLGTRITLEQGAAGVVTVAAAGGVTVNSRGGLMNTNGQYARLVLEKTATDRWLLSGDRA